MYMEIGKQISQAGNLIPTYTNAPLDKAFSYNGNFTLNVDVDNANIIAINLRVFHPWLLSINWNTNIGSIITTNTNIFPIQINDNATLTLYGTGADITTEGFEVDNNTYTGLGSVTLSGQNAILNIIQANLGAITIINNIDSTTDGRGVLNIVGNINIRGSVGVNKALNKINLLVLILL